MKEICSTDPKYSGIRSKVGLKCDLCTEENTPCARHQKEGCNNDDCVCILSLRHLLKKAPSCKRNLLNKRHFSELNNSPWAQAEGTKLYCASAYIYYNSCLSCDIIYLSRMSFG